MTDRVFFFKFFYFFREISFQTLESIDFSKIYWLKALEPKNKRHTNCYECCDLTKKIRSVTNYRLVVVLVLILTKCFAKLQRSFKNSGKKCHSLALNISYCSTFDFPTPRKDKCIVVLDIFFSSNHNIHKSSSGHHYRASDS